ncbi:hypothetical protein GP486_002501 [Trichoglossum hirsutum]|uniref:DUF2428 domain-containing protein n=1 Tax=Trichoglossum hirsutum TaxID=265104 RepID=A0A9P8RRN3_9PEZI|nr:hypothetical protein GP486_002501 [Trichoglossum hirsutum]
MRPLYVSEQHLSEESLRDIGRSLGSLFPTVQDASVESITQLEGVLGAILCTAQSTQISQSHRAAACNALTAFLGKCQSSSIVGLKSLSRPDYLWIDIFNFYLERSDKAKVKPMRQVLVTLASIALGDPDCCGTRKVLDIAVTRVITIIFRQEAYSRVKPALQALDYFISKRVFSLKDLLRLVQAWLIESGAGAPDDIYEISSVDDPIPAGEAPNLVRRAYGYCVTILASAILRWIPEPDVAPAAGDMFITLFSALKRQADKWMPVQIADAAVPAWCGPLEAFIQGSPDALENIKQHVFPGLFKLSVVDFNFFLLHLGIDDILSRPPMTGDTRTMILFIALQVGKEIGLVEDSAKAPQANAVVVLDALIGGLLARASAAIRLAALSLLVASPSTTRPFSSGVLSLLEKNLAFFHGDTDAKFRTDVLSTTKRLVDRLRGGTLFLSRETRRNKKGKADQNTHSKAGSRVVGEQRIAAEDAECPASRLRRHVEFLNWYIAFLIAELQPTASYQRHITALKALDILLQSGLDEEVPIMRLSKLAQGEAKWPFHIKVLEAPFRRVLLDLLADPFDDVRGGAANILKMASPDSTYLLKSTTCIGIPPQDPHTDSKQETEITQEATSGTVFPDIFCFLGRLERAMHLSGRADHADGVARTYEIIFDMSSRCYFTITQLGPSVKSQHRDPHLLIVNHLMSALEQGLSVARKDLALAVSSSPVHGYLSGIRLILDRPNFYHTLLSLDEDGTRAWKELHQRIIGFCQGIWDCVKGSLCSDSPEGHIPEDFDDGDLGTKDILSYSWRALKESSTTLRTIISSAIHNPRSELSILDEGDIRAIGQLSFTQLAELRHRGAFSTVSLTFAACCQRCYREKHINQLLNVWYKNTLDCIRDQASTTTRRSAGIPSLITGIMTADPGGALFNQIILDMLAEARLPLDTSSGEQEVKLPQVHALNCLKDVFANSRLGQFSEQYLAEALELSVRCLGSDVWAIRNCGIMLFRALADRLFGTNEARNKEDIKTDNKVSKLSYDKYPNLPGLLKKLLDQTSGCSSQTESEGHTVSIFPVLDSPESVFPAMDIIRRAGPPKTNSTELRSLILLHMESEIWHVRDMAARTFCSLINRPDFIEEVSYLINLPWISNNALHGRLLGVRYLLQEYLPQVPGSFRDAIQRIVPLFRIPSNTISETDMCPITKGTFLEVVNIVLDFYMKICCTGETVNCPLSHSINQLCEDMGFFQFLDRILVSTKYPGAQCRQYTSDALYRKALVHSIILHHCLRKHIRGLQPLIEALAENDPDALSDAIEFLKPLIPTGSAVDTLLDVGATLFPAIEINSSPEVKARIANYIAELCEGTPLLAPSLFVYSRRDIADTWLAYFLGFGIPRGCFGSPSLTDAELRLCGSVLAAQCSQQSIWSDRLTSMLGVWATMLHEAGDERNTFSTRMAAAMSLNAFKSALRMPGGDPRSDASLLNVYVVLFDTLSDDDEEIRDMGAAIVSWTLSPSSGTAPGLSLLPLAANLRLSEWLSSQYSLSKDLLTTAVQRLTLHSRWLPPNVTDEAIEALESVENLLAKATKEDRSLFVKEKQNLFIDETREAEVWSRVLLGTARETPHEQLAKAYIAWVKEGLLTLSERVKAKVMDGPLGWTSKPEVFAVGIHVILGANVVLQWMKRDCLCDGEEVIAALKYLAEVGRQASLHELWLSRINAVIEQHSRRDGENPPNRLEVEM